MSENRGIYSDVFFCFFFNFSDTISPRDNAIEQLFYGTFITESVVDMATPSAVNGTATPQKNENGDDASTGLDVQVVPTKKEERFSQYPLQVVGCETLHDSMEKSLRPEESPEVEVSLHLRAISAACIRILTFCSF